LRNNSMRIPRRSGRPTSRIKSSCTASNTHTPHFPHNSHQTFRKFIQLKKNTRQPLGFFYLHLEITGMRAAWSRISLAYTHASYAFSWRASLCHAYPCTPIFSKKIEREKRHSQR
jgi:hypothetical protein